ncbi:MAG: DUF4337 domain-containing protein [Myxococcales bacterium]|jgi:hypothetical protein|nr:DUF4337 domain-containing protein [Myxococcales bacterium]
MGDIHEKVSEAIDHAGGGDGPEDRSKAKLNAAIAAIVAVAATFMALCNVKAGNVVQAMGKVQVEIVDTWSFFQAKSTKQSLAEAALDQLAIQHEAPQIDANQRAHLEKQMATYREKITRYDKEKGELKAKVDGLEKEYDRLNLKDDQFDISEALLSVGIALLGITALTQKRWLLGVAVFFAGSGLLIGTAGFAGWSIRPQWLASLLGA